EVLTETDDGPTEALLGLDITASQLRDQDICQNAAVVSGYQRNGAAPGAASHLGVRVSDEPIADAARVLGLPTAPVADLRQGVQCLGELLRYGRVERSDQSGHGLIGRQAGQRPGEHVADEEVRFDRASAHEGVEIAA